jgi:hypothetical protein
MKMIFYYQTEDVLLYLIAAKLKPVQSDSVFAFLIWSEQIMNISFLVLYRMGEYCIKIKKNENKKEGIHF